jgi:hypothetical protein
MFRELGELRLGRSLIQPDDRIDAYRLIKRRPPRPLQPDADREKIPIRREAVLKWLVGRDRPAGRPSGTTRR